MPAFEEGIRWETHIRDGSFWRCFLKESEIRPADIFEEYLRLAAEDVKTFFGQVRSVPVLCPACGDKGHPAFEKGGFFYEECEKCKTLFVSPRPEKAAFDRYYLDAPSTRYWATTFYKATEDARREKLWKPKARELAKTLQKYPQIRTVVDIGGGYGTFAEEFARESGMRVVVVEPSIHLAEVCRKKGLQVVEKFLEDLAPDDLPQGQKCFTSFELFEHLHDPSIFLENIYTLMNQGDLFAFTTLSGMGVDIQVLWEHSKSVSPPHHLNFFNPKSVSELLVRHGFTVQEVTTPGKLDLSIMANSQNNIKDRFWKSLLETATEAELSALQQSLQDHKLSSHMRVICTK